MHMHFKGGFQQHTGQSAEVPGGSAVTSEYHALYLALPACSGGFSGCQPPVTSGSQQHTYLANQI